MDEDDERVENEEDDAREEDIVEDTDADTRDVEENDDRNNAEIERRFSILEATLDRILGELSSIRESQGIMVENGAVIHESDTNIDYDNTDDFEPPAEMDLLI